MKKSRIIKELLLTVQRENIKGKKKDPDIQNFISYIKEQMEHSRLVPSDRYNPLLGLLSKVLYDAINEMANNSSGKAELEDYIIKFLNGTLTETEEPTVSNTLGYKPVTMSTMGQSLNNAEPYRCIGVDANGFPIYDFSQPNYVNYPLTSPMTVQPEKPTLSTSTPEFMASLPTTGNIEYDHYLDDILKWGKENKIEFNSKTTLSGFCHALSLYQKDSTLTQPETDAGKLYTAFMKRFFKKK